MIALDGTATKSRLGANALLAVSMAAARAEAAASATANGIRMNLQVIFIFMRVQRSKRPGTMSS